MPVRPTNVFGLADCRDSEKQSASFPKPRLISQGSFCKFLTAFHGSGVREINSELSFFKTYPMAGANPQPEKESESQNIIVVHDIGANKLHNERSKYYE
jgi:hypothetical protein